MFYNSNARLVELLPHLRDFMTSDVADALLEVKTVESNETWLDAKIYRDSTPNNYIFTLSNNRIVVDKSFSKAELYTSFNNNKYNKSLSDLLLDVFRYVALWNNGLVAHGAVVMYAGKTLMFSGLSGAGKSTQANLWSNIGAWVLNYDKPVLWMKNTLDKVYISGTPWSGKEPCYHNATLPLTGIIFVKQSNINSIRKLSKAEAYTMVYPNYMLYPLDDKVIDNYDSAVTYLINNTPIYELECTPTIEAVYCVMNEIKIDYEAKKGRNLLMKAKEGFLLRDIAGEKVLIPRGELALDFNASIIFNDTAAFLWEKLSQKENMSIDKLIGSLLSEFNVTYDQAEKDVISFVNEMKQAGIINE